MSDIAAEEANGKVNQLQLVFSKAMDVTFESLGPNDITSCFGELRNELGNSLDGKLVQQLALSKNRLQSEFEALCHRHNLAGEFLASSQMRQQAMNGSSGGAVQDIRAALAQVEEEQMARLVAELEKENARLLESREETSQQMRERVAAVGEEGEQLRSAADQL